MSEMVIRWDKTTMMLSVGVTHRRLAPLRNAQRAGKIREGGEIDKERMTRVRVSGERS